MFANSVDGLGLRSDMAGPYRKMMPNPGPGIRPASHMEEDNYTAFLDPTMTISPSHMFASPSTVPGHHHAGTSDSLYVLSRPATSSMMSSENPALRSHQEFNAKKTTLDFHLAEG